MKKYFSFAMALVAMLAMVSASSGCSDDGVDYSVTIVAKTTLSLSKNAGTGRLAYEIQGADKSSIVEATTNVDWIKNFNYAEPGYVQFDTLHSTRVSSLVRGRSPFLIRGQPM